MQNKQHKIAVMSDVHGNLPALQAALKSIKNKNCDIIYHLGDAVAIGPYPGDCLRILLAQSNLKLVMGNHAQWFAYGLPTPVPDWMNKGEIDHHKWLEKFVDDNLREEVADFPYVIKNRYKKLNIVCNTFYSHLDKEEKYEV